MFDYAWGRSVRVCLLSSWQAKMEKLLLVFSLFVLHVNSQPGQASFGETNVVWTVYTGKKTVAAFISGDIFRGPRRYGTIPWIYRGKIPYGISYHYDKNLLIMSDLARNNIYTINTASNQSWNSTLFLAGFGWVEHTAVDWISDNVYWVDAYYEWIAMKPIDATDPADYKVIADASVISPRGIAVDPNRGYLFWTDVSKPARIVRAAMDGSNQLVLVAKALINPFDITIKPENGQIFWIDRSRDTLETVMNDGSQRDVIFTSHQGQPVGVSYYRDHIFMADTNFDDVLILDLVNGLSKTYFKLNQRVLGVARVLTVWAKENQPDQNSWKGKCQSQNCEHYCVLDSNGNPKCFCQENYQLQSDGRACKQISQVPHHALILTNGSHICSYDITVMQLKYEPSLHCFAEGQNQTDIGNLAVDSNGKAVYYSSSVRRQIRKLNIEDGTSSLFSANIPEVGGMSFDYVEGVLYWSDLRANQVKKQAGSGVASPVFFENNLGDVAVDPYHRLLFYIKKDDKAPSIVKHDLDSSNGDKTPLTSVHPIDPRRLAYNDKSQQLYWSDQGKIQMVSWDGKASPSVGTLNIDNRAITYYGKFLMWSTAQRNGTSLLHMYKPPDKNTYKRLRVNFQGVITDYGIFDRMRHTQNKDSCYVRNGGCNHICIPGTIGDKCTCKLGYTLNNKDKVSCDSNMVADNYTFASDPMSKRVVQVDLKTGKIAGTDIGEGTLVSNVVVIGQNAYWADQTARVIFRSNPDGSKKQSLYSSGLMSVQRIAVDPSTENIYMTLTDGNLGKIMVINQDGTRAKTLIDDAKFPKDIKLHSKYGLMFWVERRGFPGIERATMAGGSRLLIHRPAKDSDIYGIEIDFETDMLYWCDKKDGYIRRSDLFGASIDEVIQDKETSITDIAILGKYLYYTGTNRNGILRINKKDATNALILAESAMISQLHDISIVSKSVKFPKNAECANSNALCSSLCIPINDTRKYVCGCADGDTLTSNLQQCAGDLHPSITAHTSPATGATSQNPFVSRSSTSSVAPSPGVTQAAKQESTVTTDESGPNKAAIGVPIAIILLIAIAVIVVVVLYRRRQAKRSPLVSEPRGSENPGYFNGSNVETVKT